MATPCRDLITVCCMRLPFWLLAMAVLLAVPAPVAVAQPDAPAEPDADADEQPEMNPLALRQLTNRIRLVLPQLMDPRHVHRIRAIRELQSLPPDANGILLERLPSLRPRQQIAVIEVLASREMPGTPARILDLLPTLEPAHDHRMLDALRAFGHGGWTELNHRLFGAPGSPSPPVRQPRLEKLYTDFVRAEVLEELRVRLEAGGRTGYHAEMFAEVYRLGSVAIQTLADAARNRDNILQGFTAEQVFYIRPLAIRAMGDSGHPDARTHLRALYDEYGDYEHEDDSSVEHRCFMNTVWSLYLVGDTRPAAERIRVQVQLIESMSATPEKAERLQRLAHNYLQINEYEQALEAFREVIQIANRFSHHDRVRELIPNTYYNLSCTYSKLARGMDPGSERERMLRQGLASLRLAVENGFDNWDWIFRDRDLHALWATEAFGKWIADLRADARHAGLIPAWEPGNPPEDRDEDDLDGDDDAE